MFKFNLIALSMVFVFTSCVADANGSPDESNDEIEDIGPDCQIENKTLTWDLALVESSGCTGYNEAVVLEYKNKKSWTGDGTDCIEEVERPLKFDGGLTANMDGILTWSGINHAEGTLTVVWPSLGCSAIYEAQVY